ncbi:MAG: caspase family protein [Cyclobacteriaceae bacterium]|nr:caspase family protein [Cyclobacteriaceae bacterium]
MKKSALMLSVPLLLICALGYSQEKVVSGKSNPVTVSYSSENSGEFAPVLTWITPAEQGATFDAKKVNLEVGVKSSTEVSEVTIYIDGEPLASERGLGVAAAKADDYDQVIKRELDLQNGTHEIRLLVENEAGEAALEFRTINVDAPVILAAGRRDYALIIGTDQYDEWDNLTNPVFDAQTIATELTESYGFEVDLNLNLTTSEMLTKIREYGSKNFMKDDQLFIFIAGHGQFDEVFTEGYVVGKNSKKIDPAKESYISHSTLRTYVSNIPSNHIFLAMDVCFGGTFDQAIAQAGHRGADMYGEIETSDYIERKLRFKTRKYLTSGGKQYVPDGRPGEHSPFARHFIDALRSYGGRDKILTLGEIVNFVERISPEPKFGDFPGDEPGSDFIFVAK